MEAEGSLPHSQVPATCPYPEPDRSSPCPPSHFLKIRFNITLPSTPGSFKWSLSPRFLHQNPVYSLPIHSTYPVHLIRLHFITRTIFWWAVQIIKVLIMQFSPLPCYLVPLRPKYSPQHPIFKHPQPTFLPQCEQPSVKPRPTPYN